MIRTALAVAALFVASSASAAPACRDDHGKFIKCPAVAEHHPMCKIGKPCGNTCISKDKVCHK
jgi:uncharacterized membrane protein